MVRLIGMFVGAGLVLVLLWSLLSGAIAVVREPAAETAEHAFHLYPRKVDFAHEGPLGRFDRQQLQRGFQVYKEVCASCHSLKYVAFRDLEQIGFSKAEVKAIARDWPIETQSVNPETGEAATRKSLAADRFPSPYANEVAARAANNNAIPPDQSLLTKARHDGPAYVYSLLTGYQRQPEKLLREFPDSKTGPGLHYNPYFANLNIAMAPPLTTPNQVSYADGTPATVDQMAKDVSAFLTWTAEPKLETRHQVGWAAMIFLLIFTTITYFAYQSIWADKKGPKRGSGKPTA